MYNVILCAISLHGTKHINHEFEFATTKDPCIMIHPNHACHTTLYIYTLLKKLSGPLC